ncbi:MAG: ribonuclease P protein component [Candidatus Levybacteria bacterium]|nr:ribonuclease P protein component [Candidatus Levybacteria bacterium]
MLKKQYRLGKKERTGLSSPLGIRHTALFVMRFWETENLYPRFAFVVTKRVDKKAVERNRLRRMMQACVQKHYSKIHRGYIIVVSAKKEMKGSSGENVCQQITTVLKKEQIL